MSTPFYIQAAHPLPGGIASNWLIDAAKWWKTILRARLAQEIDLIKEDKIVNLFTDAASDPPIVAAVLFNESKVYYTHWEADSEFKQTLNMRQTSIFFHVQVKHIFVM